MDTFTKIQRSKCMSRIRSKNTVPELAVRKYLTSLKIRYRLHSQKIPGKPDIIITRLKIAIFINGCFWHQHKGCGRCTIPKTNILYWQEKLKNNVLRQSKIMTEIKNIGWHPIIIWECQTKDILKIASRLSKEGLSEKNYI